LAVTEFWMGYIVGALSCAIPLMLLAFFKVGGFADDERYRDYQEEEQPDIRLTTIKSEHVRSYTNAERD
jgi:hypothetical protein